MKQFLLLSGLLLLAAVGSLQTPFWGLLLYYGLAVLRPQHLWEWALPADVRWSLWAAVIVLLATAMHGGGLLRRARLNILAGLMIAFGVLLLASTVGAYDPHIAQSWAVEYAKVLLIAVLAAVLIERVWQVRTLAVMVCVCLGYVAWEVNYQYVFEGRLGIFHYGFAGLDNNGAGMLIAMGLPFAYYVAMRRGVNGTWRWAWPAAGALGGALMLHAVLMSYSRGAMLAAGVGVGWLIVRHRPRRQAAMLAVTGAIAIAVLAGPEIRQRFWSTFEYERDYSAQSRLDSWSAAWQIAWERPLLGQGVRNSNLVSQNFGADFQGRTIHNQYLQIAADSGVPAACVYLLMLGVSLHRLSSCRRQSQAAAADSSGHVRGELDDTARLCLALQASLLTFAAAGVFLSLETFELPWLLMAIAGVMPAALQRRLDALRDNAVETAPVRDAVDSWSSGAAQPTRPIDWQGATS